MKITFEMTSIDDLREAAQLLSQLVGAQPQAAEPDPKPKKAARTQPAAEAKTAEPAPAQESPSDDAPAEPAPEPEPEASAKTEAPTLEEVRALLAELSKAGKVAQVKALLTDFGAAKLTDIPSEKYGDLMAAAREL